MNSINQHLQYWTEAANGRHVKQDQSESETRIERAKRLFVQDKIELDVMESRLERIFSERYL